MNRTDFIKWLLTGAGLTTALPWRHVSREEKPVLTKLLTCPVAGYQYHKGVSIEHHIMEGLAARLVREPEHPDDPCAIAVYVLDKQVGYIPRSENQILSVLMDQGIPVHAHIDIFDPEAPPWERLWLLLEMEMASNLQLPTLVSP